MNKSNAWFRRWKALDTHIEQSIQLFEQGKVPDDLPEKQTIWYLLKSLRAFGQSHFNYFFSGLLLERPNLNDPKEEFPVDSVLRSIIDQIAYDFELISKALHQRLPPYHNEKRGETLQNASRLGRIALLPAIRAGFIEKTEVLTYFQKSYSVRVIPYSNVAIVGVPFTALELPRDYLAIPHETAHHIYRHGSFNDKAISSHLKNDLKQAFKKEDLQFRKYLRNWVEEIFADIYGCLIAGPVMAVNFQELQLDDPLVEFAKSYIDYEDPVPIVRPDIYTKVLANSGQRKWQKWAAPVGDLWQDHRNTYWDDFRKTKLEARDRENAPFFTTFNGRYTLDDIRAPGEELKSNLPLDLMIKNVLDFIDRSFTKENVAPPKLFNWSKTEEGVDLTTLYERFSEFVVESENLFTDDLKEQMRPDLDVNSDSFDTDIQINDHLSLSIGWVKWITRWVKVHGFDEIIEDNKATELLDKRRKPKSSNTDWGWADVAYADGWVTRGPEPNPPGDGVG
ncbi:hypothetical protein [Candidatus Leptofilum sp.]|uniref:hypothetical protein n=1 Tax=Candidatus Leptofilum sp. TaxID=3241576 RepID=UPI003B595751